MWPAGRSPVQISFSPSFVNSAVELSDQRDAYVAGMEANLKIQQEILRAILGIQIGDETIAKANERYAHKMAVAEGGVL